MTQDLFGICPYVTAQRVLRGKWSIVILHHLEDGPVRFNELQRRLPEMTHATLAKQLCIAGWAIICDLILFTILKKTVGVRVSEREELEGLDATEHGLETGYAGFLMDKDN